MKILIVDDSIPLRARISQALSSISGIELIGEAETYKEALESCKKHQPDLILLDIRLRLGNGIDVLRELKKCDSSPKVIVFTGFPYPHYQKRCKDEGADFFVSKKDGLDRVIQIVNSLTQQSALVN